ncbi:Metallo-dependent phosphatase-like protein [Auriculariales sp. MPI-PUGE-AT-0066]|nr:Metallo-dependent phosphatase-like protein [Auriculariales sp. MPI-PUGE-AT-0066]
MLSASLVLLSVALSVSATDYLVAPSARLGKRGLTAEGNYNIKFAAAGTDCTAPEKGCYGGYARIKDTIDTLRPKTPDSLFLNIGDEFQGTLFYTYYKGEKIAETINQLGFDAMTLGNHEFDGGEDELGAFLKNLTFPVVCANIITEQKTMNSTIKPYTLFEKHQLAVIGVTTDTTPDISSPAKSTKFLDPTTTVQQTIDYIKANEKNITRFVAITHIGYDVDQQLAKNTKGLHMIIGGHSHTLLGDMDGAEGKYPTIVQNLDGEDVFIVTSFRWGEYLGQIEVSFAPDGKIVAYTGAPIHMINTTAQDTKLQAQIEGWEKPFEALAKEEVGTSETVLDQTKCKSAECVLGDVMCDAIKDYRKAADFAVINGGGVRATIDQGTVTRGEVMTAFPFGNVVVEVPLSGIFSQHSLFNDRAVISGVQVSKELKIVWNPNNANGSRLISIDVNGAAIDKNKTYTVATIDFVAKGGDNQFPAQDMGKLATLDAMDEVLVRYINASSPIKADIDGRISTSDAKGSSGGTGAAGALTVSGVLASSLVIVAAFALVL